MSFQNFESLYKIKNFEFDWFLIHPISESELKLLENSAQIFNALSDIPGDIDDVDQLFEVALDLSGSLTDVLVETHRRRHLAYLMADQGGLVGNPDAAPNLPKQHLNRRQMKRNKSVLQTFLFGSDDSEDDAKSKNIRQTGKKLRKKFKNSSR